MYKFFLSILAMYFLSCIGMKRAKTESKREKELRYNQNILHVKQAFYMGKINKSSYDSLLIRLNNNKEVNLDEVLNN